MVFSATNIWVSLTGCEEENQQLHTADLGYGGLEGWTLGGHHHGGGALEATGEVMDKAAFGKAWRSLSGYEEKVHQWTSMR